MATAVKDFEQDSWILHEHLSIILTTSPTPSIPSAELVSTVLASLPAALDQCPLYITFDGYVVSNKLDGRLKRGQIPQSMADQYPQYISNVKNLFSSYSTEILDKRMHSWISQSSGSDRSVMFLRQEYRQGFAFNVKSALFHVTTPYVLILQHDWVFNDPSPPFKTLLQVMEDEASRIKYITFVARQSLQYETSRGGVTPHYGAIFSAARRMRSDAQSLKDDLIACLHFFDRPHLCCTALYRDIFAQNLLKRGDFLEDTFGCALINRINAATTEAESIRVWQQVGTWMYYPENGNRIDVRHTSGRTSLTREKQLEKIQQHIVENRARHSINKNE